MGYRTVSEFAAKILKIAQMCNSINIKYKLFCEKVVLKFGW